MNKISSKQNEQKRKKSHAYITWNSMTWNRYSGKSCFLSIVKQLFFFSTSHSKVNRFHNTRLHLHFSIILFVVIQQEVQRSENFGRASARASAFAHTWTRNGAFMRCYILRFCALKHTIHPLIYFPLKPHLKFRVQRFSTLKCIFDDRKRGSGRRQGARRTKKKHNNFANSIHYLRDDYLIDYIIGFGGPE